MTKLTVAQATELMQALYGPCIELVVNRATVIGRCTVYSAKYTDNWTALRMELCHGSDWLECIAKVLPEIIGKDFHPIHYPWSQYLAELRQIRKSKQTCQADSERSVRADHAAEQELHRRIYP